MLRNYEPRFIQLAELKLLIVSTGLAGLAGLTGLTGLFLPLDRIVDLSAVNGNFARCIYPQTNLIAADIDYGDFDVIANNY